MTHTKNCEILKCPCNSVERKIKIFGELKIVNIACVQLMQPLFKIHKGKEINHSGLEWTTSNFENYFSYNVKSYSLND